MIDIPKLARESGASLDDFPVGVGHEDIVYVAWWRFSPDELQLYTEKAMLAAKAEELERSKKLLVALKYARRFLKKELHDVEFIDATIAKYEGEANDI
jgi:hypothetical protein